MHLPFQKVKKNIVWGRYIDCDNRHFFPLSRQLTLFYQQVINLYSAKKQQPHLFNVECCKLHEKLLPYHRNYGMVVILLSFLCNYDNLTLKLHHENRSYPDERWLFIDRFKVGSVPGKSCSCSTQKSIKIHHEYDARSLMKS